MIQRLSRRLPGGSAMEATAAMAVGFASGRQMNRYLFAPSSQTIFFSFLYDSVAMWPEIAACCPMGGGAITFSLPRIDSMKFLKWLIAPSLSLKAAMPLMWMGWRERIFTGALSEAPGRREL